MQQAKPWRGRLARKRCLTVRRGTGIQPISAKIFFGDLFYRGEKGGKEENWLTEDRRKLMWLLPEGRKEQARKQGALRRERKIRDPEQLRRYILMHEGPGLSLAQAVARAEQCGLPKIPDVALMERMKGSEDWVRWMCQKLLGERHGGLDGMEMGGYRVVAVDSTTIQEPGATGTDWRLHYEIELPGLFCEQAQLTDSKGGESLCRYEIRKGDLIPGRKTPIDSDPEMKREEEERRVEGVEGAGRQRDGLASFRKKRVGTGRFNR
jgi:hypothetical protein